MLCIMKNKKESIWLHSSRLDIMNSLCNNKRYWALTVDAHFETNINRKLEDRSGTYFLRDIDERPHEVLYQFYKFLTP